MRLWGVKRGLLPIFFSNFEPTWRFTCALVFCFRFFCLFFRFLLFEVASGMAGILRRLFSSAHKWRFEVSLATSPIAWGALDGVSWWSCDEVSLVVESFMEFPSVTIQARAVHVLWVKRSRRMHYKQLFKRFVWFALLHLVCTLWAQCMRTRSLRLRSIICRSR